MEKMTAAEKTLKTTNEISKKMEINKRILEEKIGLNKSFDVVLREMVLGRKRVGLLYLNGLVNGDVLVEVIKRLTYLEAEQVCIQPVKHFMEMYISHIQVILTDKMDDVIEKVLTGKSAFFIENETSALLIDAKEFPTRSIKEPDLEKVVRGAHDGFVETLLMNVSLVRRRIRDPQLTLEIIQVGRRTQMDVCVAYIQDIAQPQLVESLRDKIKSIQVDGIPLAEKQLEEAMVNKGWNPYPSVHFSERPDIVSAHLLEGHVAIFVDTSPSVILMPTTFFHLIQYAEENRQTPCVGTYLRWVRYIGILASLFLLPLWFLMVMHPELKPAGLEWLGPHKMGHLPLLLQFVFAEIGVDLMRLAAIHTPSPLTTAMGLIAAILVGDIAVKTGLFANEVILYLAVATIGTYATPSYELGLANRLFRLAILVVTAIFSIPGFVVGSTLWVILLTVDRSFNSPYFWPFIPFNARALLEVIIRRPFMSAKTRLSLTKPTDNTRR